eukprot:m.83221 g.83221  ORF g.83221 m.83221 type:complete len:803 (-) comp12716_c1_seq3:603-3011(-)
MAGRRRNPFADMHAASQVQAKSNPKAKPSSGTIGSDPFAGLVSERCSHASVGEASTSGSIDDPFGIGPSLTSTKSEEAQDMAANMNATADTKTNPKTVSRDADSMDPFGTKSATKQQPETVPSEPDPSTMKEALNPFGSASMDMEDPPVAETHPSLDLHSQVLSDEDNPFFSFAKHESSSKPSPPKQTKHMAKPIPVQKAKKPATAVTVRSVSYSMEEESSSLTTSRNPLLAYVKQSQKLEARLPASSRAAMNSLTNGAGATSKQPSIKSAPQLKGEAGQTSSQTHSQAQTSMNTNAVQPSVTAQASTGTTGSKSANTQKSFTHRRAQVEAGLFDDVIEREVSPLSAAQSDEVHSTSANFFDSTPTTPLDDHGLMPWDAISNVQELKELLHAMHAEKQFLKQAVRQQEAEISRLHAVARHAKQLSQISKPLEVAQGRGSTSLSPRDAVTLMISGEPCGLEAYRSISDKRMLLKMANMRGGCGMVGIKIARFLESSLSSDMAAELLRKAPNVARGYVLFLARQKQFERAHQLARDSDLQQLADTVLTRSIVAVRSHQQKLETALLFALGEAHKHGREELIEKIQSLQKLFRIQSSIDHHDDLPATAAAVPMLQRFPKSSSLVQRSPATTLFYSALYHYQDDKSVPGAFCVVSPFLNLDPVQAEYTVVKALARAKDWPQIESLLTKRVLLRKRLSPSVPALSLVELLAKAHAPEDVLAKYLALISDLEERLETADKYNCYDCMIETLMALRDAERLRALSNRPEVSPNISLRARISSALRNPCFRFISLLLNWHTPLRVHRAVL